MIGADQEVIDFGHQLPHCDVRKNSAKGFDDRLYIPLRQRIGLYPSADESSFGQTLAAGREELPGEQIGHSGDPQVGRLGDDDIVLLIPERNVVAAIADNQLQPLVAQGVVIDLAEEFRSFCHFGGEFDAFYCLHRILFENSQTDSASQAYEQHIFRGGVEQQGDMDE